MIGEVELRRQANFATDWERRFSYLVRDTPSADYRRSKRSGLVRYAIPLLCNC